MARGERREPRSELPAPYRSPWASLGEALAAAGADLWLRLRELWRLNRQGDLPRPSRWPQALAPLFWPLLLALLLLVAGALTWRRPLVASHSSGADAGLAGSGLASAELDGSGVASSGLAGSGASGSGSTGAGSTGSGSDDWPAGGSHSTGAPAAAATPTAPGSAAAIGGAGSGLTPLPVDSSPLEAAAAGVAALGAAGSAAGPEAGQSLPLPPGSALTAEPSVSQGNRATATATAPGAGTAPGRVADRATRRTANTAIGTEPSQLDQRVAGFQGGGSRASGSREFGSRAGSRDGGSAATAGSPALAPAPQIDPLLRLVAGGDGDPLLLAAHADPAAARLSLTLSEAAAVLSDRSLLERASRWQQRALEAGYERLELRDPQGRLRGRQALVGSGMILLAPDPLP